MQVDWQRGEGPRRLREGDVDLWRFPLNRDVTPVLAANEEVRAARFALPQHRRAFEARRTRLRRLLAAYLGCGPLEFEFTYSPDGRPELAGYGDQTDLRFSSSNTEEWLLIGVTLTSEIGVDIERTDVARDYESLARECFSERELTVYGELSADEKTLAFVKAWVQKEAFVKAIGSGITFPLRNVDVSIEPGRPGSLNAVAGGEWDASNWSLTCFQPIDFHLAALAVSRPLVSISWFEGDITA